MIRHLLHWADAEYWGQSWPNIFAPSVWTRGAAAAARNHEDMKRHVSNMASERGGA